MKGLLLVWLAASCRHPAGLPTRIVAVDGTELSVEVADDPGERSQGLMHRQSMDPDKGMLFVYSKPAERSFWMANTSIPLSIAFLDTEGRILNIEPLVPFDHSPVLSKGEALYAIETNRVWFTEHGVVPGAIFSGLPEASER